MVPAADEHRRPWAGSSECVWNLLESHPGGIEMTAATLPFDEHAELKFVVGDAGRQIVLVRPGNEGPVERRGYPPLTPRRLVRPSGLDGARAALAGSRGQPGHMTCGRTCSVKASKVAFDSGAQMRCSRPMVSQSSWIVSRTFGAVPQITTSST